MKNKKFLKVINKYMLSEGILPTAQNIKAAQQGDSFLGRAYNKLNYISNSMTDIANAFSRGHLDEIVGAVNSAITGYSDAKAKWLNRQYIMSLNYVKDIVNGSIININVKDDMIMELLEYYPALKDIIGDDEELKMVVTYVNQLHYNEYQTLNPSFDQLWGKLYTTPEKEEIRLAFNELNIDGLYISFCAEDTTNSCYCVWIDNNLNPINTFRQYQKNVRKLSNGEYSLSAPKGNDVHTLISDFLKATSNWIRSIKDNKIKENFNIILNGFANNLASRRTVFKENAVLTEMYKLWAEFFKASIDAIGYKRIDVSPKDVQIYFTNLTDELNKAVSDTETKPFRMVFDRIIKNYTQ